MILLPKKRRPWWSPWGGLGFALGDWRIGPAGNPVLVNGTISTGEDCCCCITCCSPGTSPPQLEIDATDLTMNTIGPFCGADCAFFADVFIADFRSTRVTDTPGDIPTGTCLYRYCGGTLDCVGTPYQWGWDAYIRSTGVNCEAVAVPWIGGTGCDDFNRAPTGTTAVWRANLPTDPADCCSALATPLTLNPVGVDVSAIIGNADGGGGCQVLSYQATTVTIRAVGC